MSIVNKIKYGNTNTFLIRGSKANLLIDTDYAGTLSAFYKAIKNYEIKISDITYVIATHYHPDHMGLISELVNMGVKLILIDSQYEYTHFSDKIFERDNIRNYKPINEDNAIIIKCEDSREFLNSIGISGEIIYTPSHSNDSISIILDSKECFVGDLEPSENLITYENYIELESDWKKIEKYNPKIIYYSHRNEKIIY